ncbi:MAG: bifunctional pyr operon transcriptional regulator/uracil phosphoribosyltransferase PyrR [Salibacteraceae bacterium]
MKTEVLSHIRLERIIQRIAYQTLESLASEKHVVIAGILPRGIWVAKKLVEQLNEISDLQIDLVELKIDDPKLEVNCEGKTVLLVDDIVNSGKNMMGAAGFLYQQHPHRVLTACLIDRMHRRFPIQIDFTGQSLATTLQEHLTLVLDDKPRIILE